MSEWSRSEYTERGVRVDDREIGRSDDGQYRVIERPVHDGRREYWLQRLDDATRQWKDVRGPYMQRPAALRRLRPDVH